MNKSDIWIPTYIPRRGGLPIKEIFLNSTNFFKSDSERPLTPILDLRHFLQALALPFWWLS